VDIAHIENCKKYAPGTRIYYMGDRANLPSYGTITKFRPADKWGPESVDIQFDEERFEGDYEKIAHGITLAAFKQGPGRRFWLAEEWDTEINRQLSFFKQKGEVGRGGGGSHEG